MSTGVKLSAAPIDWGVAELVPGNPDPIELLDWVAAAGYTGCELGTHGYFGFTSDAILELFRPRGLAVSASWYDVDLSQPLLTDQAAEIDQICSFLEAGGANVINISDKIVDARAAVVGRVLSFPETWWPDEAWKQVTETLLQIHEVTARRGITVAFHQHVATHIESDREIRLLIEAVQGTPIRFCIDSGHLTLGGSDPVALVNELRDAVVHIHAKDVDGPMLARLQSGEIDYFAATGQGLYSDLGTGIVDWTGLRDGLVKAGFGGWVVAEQDRLLVSESRIPFDANKRNFAFLAGLFKLN
jgi:inosose dehydratase